MALLLLCTLVMRAKLQTVVFELPFLPPSENNMYYWDRARGTQKMYTSVKKFKSDTMLLMPRIVIGKNVPTEIFFEFHGDWYFKNGNMRKKDGQNLIKALIDAIFAKIGVDDCQLWTWHGKKIQADEFKTVVKIQWEKGKDTDESGLVDLASYKRHRHPRK